MFTYTARGITAQRVKCLVFSSRWSTQSLVVMRVRWRVVIHPASSNKTNDSIFITSPLHSASIRILLCRQSRCPLSKIRHTTVLTEFCSSCSIRNYRFLFVNRFLSFVWTMCLCRCDRDASLSRSVMSVY